MTRAEMIATLEREQAADDAAPRMNGHRREVQASRLESAELPNLFNLMPDPDADVPAEAIVRESLERWGAEDDAPGKGWPPSRPRETIGLGLVGWCLETEGAGLLGRSCPACGDDPGPGRYCLACTRAGKRLEAFLSRLRSHDAEVPEQWRHIETAPGRALVKDAIAAQDARERSLAERRYAGREARRASQGPPKGHDAQPRKVRMIGPDGRGRMVRAGIVGAYEASGWKVVA